MRKETENLAGQIFGRLTVEKCDGRRNNKTYWSCRCSCGTVKSVRADGLKCGDYVSCGCKKIDQLTIHGKTKTPEFKAWCSMIERCYTPTHRNFRNYGARGINVCSSWLNDFSQFLADVGPRPSDKHSLDRIDNDGDYTPSNVRWATAKVQANNRRQRNQYTGVAA
jgi:hypothetical protein